MSAALDHLPGITYLIYISRLEWRACLESHFKTSNTGNTCQCFQESEQFSHSFFGISSSFGPEKQVYETWQSSGFLSLVLVIYMPPKMKTPQNYVSVSLLMALSLICCCSLAASTNNTPSSTMTTTQTSTWWRIWAAWTGWARVSWLPASVHSVKGASLCTPNKSQSTKSPSLCAREGDHK